MVARDAGPDPEPMPDDAPPHVVAWDTETPFGFVGCLCDSEGHVFETSDTIPLLDALYKLGIGNDYNVFWNINFDLGAILKPWLIANGKAVKERFYAWQRALRMIKFADDEHATTGVWTPELVRQRAEAEAYKAAHEEGPETFDIVTGSYTRPVYNYKLNTDGTEAKNKRGKHYKIKTPLRETKSEGWRVMWIPKKGFRITPLHRVRDKDSGDRKTSAFFFDAMPFYANPAMGSTIALDKAMREWLPTNPDGSSRGKTDRELGIDRGSIGSEKGYYEANREKIIRYCIDDCKGTAELFSKTIESFKNLDREAKARGMAGGVPFPAQPWSRASVSRATMRAAGTMEGSREGWSGDKKKHIEGIWKSSAGPFIQSCYRGAIILMLAAGTFDDVTDLDIGSAYPYECTKLPSTEDARVVSWGSPGFDQCAYKFYEILLTPTIRLATREVPDAQEASAEGSLKYHQGGPATTEHVCQLDLDIFDAYGDPYTIVSGIGLMCPKGDERPLSYMSILYQLKSDIKVKFGEDSVEYLNVKVLLNGGYGVIAQSRPKPGRYANFAMAAYITAGTRKKDWMLALDVSKKGATLLGFKTDGAFFADYPEDMKKTDKRLGGWEVKDVGSVNIIGNGVYVCEGHLKKRGDPNLKQELLRDAGEPWVETDSSGPLSLKQAILWNKTEQIGIWQDAVTKEHYPARSFESVGLKVTDEMFTAPLSLWFHKGWILQPQPSTVTDIHVDPRYLQHRRLTEEKIARLERKFDAINAAQQKAPK